MEKGSPLSGWGQGAFSCVFRCCGGIALRLRASKEKEEHRENCLVDRAQVGLEQVAEPFDHRRTSLLYFMKGGVAG